MRPGTRPQGYLKRVQGEITPLSAPPEIQPRFHTPRYDQRDFPFWKLTLAIASAIVLAAALIWSAMEVRLRLELAEVNRQLEAEVRKLDADRSENRRIAAAREELKRRQELTDKELKRLEQEREKVASDAAIAAVHRDKVEGRYFPEAIASMPEGTFACSKGREIVRRTADGWQQTVRGDGGTAKCRTVL